MGHWTLLIAIAAIVTTESAAHADPEVTVIDDSVLADPCPPYVLGSPRFRWPWAPLGCDAFISAALVSTALDGTASERRSAAQRIGLLVEHALAPATRRPFRSTGVTDVLGRPLPRSILYRGFLLLMLAGLERLEPANAWSPLFDRLARDVGRDLEKSRSGWLPTYGRDRIWPCDHAPAASALVLHGVLRRDPATARSAEALVGRLAATLDRPGGFTTRVAPSGAAAEPMPRGTVLAWTAGFLLHGAPRLARRFSGTLLQDFCDVHFGMTACREWPRGVNRGPDAVSGPLVGGYGLGATGLALAAVRTLDIPLWARGPSAAAESFGGSLLASRPELRFESALFQWATTARSWLPE